MSVLVSLTSGIVNVTHGEAVEIDNSGALKSALSLSLVLYIIFSLLRVLLCSNPFLFLHVDLFHLRVGPFSSCY